MVHPEGNAELMASVTISLDDLLRPISEEHPAGLPLRDERSGGMNDYYAVRDAASEARMAERKLANYIPAMPGEEDPYKPKPPDWRVVKELAVDVLSHKSKDLWVATWLIEALCRLHGFAGLRDGFRLTRELCGQYWGQLHAGGEQGDFGDLVVQLAGLNGVDGSGTLIQPIQMIPITVGRNQPAYSYADFLAAAKLEQEEDAERRRRRIAEGEVSLDQFDAAVAESTREYYTDLLATIDAAIDEFAQLHQVLEERCRAEDGDISRSPPSSGISHELEAIRRRVAIVSGLDDSAAVTSDTADAAAGSTASVAVAASVPSGPIASRDDALRMILSLADYFERAEPHSPISYALRQIVRWGRLSLPELLAQLIDDRSVRNQMFRYIGIERSGDESED